MKTKIKKWIIFLFIASMLMTFNATPVAATPENDLRGLWHFDKVIDTTTPDSSGNDNHGSLIGPVPPNLMPTLVDGKFGYALEFDGYDDGVYVADSPSLDFSMAITIEAWIYLESYANLREHSTQTVAEKALAYYLNIQSGHLSFYWYGLSNPGYHKSPNTIPLNTWTHVAATYDGSYVKLYENGVEVYSLSVTGTGQTSNWDLGIGYEPYYPEKFPRYFEGVIDEVRVWSRALDANEIMASAQGGLRALWHLNEAPDSTTASDSSGYGNNGTLNNFPVTHTSTSGFNPGKFGNALVFDSMDDYVEVPDSPSLSVTDAITIEARVNMTSVPTNMRVICKPFSISAWTTPYADYELVILNEGGWDSYPGRAVYFGLNLGGTWTYLATSFDIVPLDTWTHLAATYDGSSMKIYINGMEKASMPVSGTIGTSGNPLFIGTRIPTPNEVFNGKIDEVRIWGRALIGDEILALSKGVELFVPSMIGQRGGPSDSFVVFTSKFSAPGRTSATVMTGIIPSDPGVTINWADDVTDLITNDKVFSARCTIGEWALGLNGKALILTIDFIGKSTPGTANTRVKLSSGETIHVQVHFK